MQEILDDDEDLAKQILEASKTSMGYDVSEIDMINVQTFADRVINLEEYRRQLREYLNARMHGTRLPPRARALTDERARDAGSWLSVLWSWRGPTLAGADVRS